MNINGGESMSLNEQAIIENIRRLINERGMKQVAVAERAGFTGQEFSNLLNGRKALAAVYIPRIAGALDVTCNDLFAVPQKHPA